ncbi:MAG: succinate dehydrogenase/fumarate reductase iron-sulfur subunit [Candidatus Bathyarchaeia archaeon]|jgi:succinate dehydrogenase / fumarate reductase iron-sulfur subunit
MQVTLKVYRFNPQTDKKPHYDTFQVEAEPNERLLDCLNRVRWIQDSTLAFRMSCAHGICGSDGLTINGQAALACQKLLKDYDYTKEILIEPLRYFRVIKDLVVDIEPFFTRVESINPFTPQPAQKSEPQEKERIQTPQELSRMEDAVKCILCACCYSACPVLNGEDEEFVGPAAVLREQRYVFDSRTANTKERLAVLEKPHGIWACKSYYKCTQVCPKNIKVTEAILRTKKIISQQQPKEQ